MTAKKFNTVFEKVSLSPQIKEVFDDAIINSVQVHKQEKIMEIKMVMTDIVHDKSVDDLKNELIENLPALKDVITVVTFNIEGEHSLSDIV